jgi:hypothetical protein
MDKQVPQLETSHQKVTTLCNRYSAVTRHGETINMRIRKTN